MMMMMNKLIQIGLHYHMNDVLGCSNEFVCRLERERENSSWSITLEVICNESMESIRKLDIKSGRSLILLDRILHITRAADQQTFIFFSWKSIKNGHRKNNENKKTKINNRQNKTIRRKTQERAHRWMHYLKCDRQNISPNGCDDANRL